MSIPQRRPAAVIRHSDRNCEYTSYAFGKQRREAGGIASMALVGDLYRKAMAESSIAWLERELLSGRRFKIQYWFADSIVSESRPLNTML